MNQSANYKCKCGFAGKVTFRKPHIVTPTFCWWICKECLTKYEFKVEKIPRVTDQVKLSERIIELGEDLRAILEEEAKEKST